MTSTSSTAENTTSQPHNTAIKIKSKTTLQVVKVAFAIFLFLGIALNIQLFVTSIVYYGEQAEKFIADDTLSLLYPLLITGVRTVVSLVFFFVGILIFVKNNDDRMVVLTSVFLVAAGTSGLWYVKYTIDPTIHIQNNNLYGAWFYYLIAWALYFMIACVFPDGRFAPRWTIITLLASMFIVFAWGQPSSSPFYAGNWGGLLFIGTHAPIFLMIMWAQVYRYRNISTPVQRQQTKWILYAGTLVILISMSIWALNDNFKRGTIGYDVFALLSDMPAILLPISLAFAMLRSRLWDIDLIINRSLAYGAVALVGILVFFGTLVGLQLVVGQTQPLVAVLIATAFSTVIYKPLHSRAQKFVDRNIYHFRFQVDELHEANKPIEIKNSGELSGMTLGKYQILDVLGKGGMGEVYKATDGTQTVAIKTLLKDKVDDSENIKRFYREAETGQALNHPNIARVHSIEEDEGIIFMVMDYLDGEDLASWLQQNKRSDIYFARNLIRDLAEALNYVHTQGFVHRDIKPSNVMLIANDDQETYRAMLTDFGITKIKDTNTLTGTKVIGTIDYMAPEQILSARDVDHRADIYALGILLYELLVGQCPFEGVPGQVLFAHIQQPAPDPCDRNPNIPRPIANAIMTALEKSPDDRFDTVLAFIDVFS
jgi:predicted Ser/Thr protein kinase